MTSQLHEQTLRLHDDFEIHYTLNGTGPLLLLITGSSGLGRHYRSLVAHLSPHFTCCTYNRRGFSTSASAPAGPSAPAIEDVVSRNAFDAASLLQHLFTYYIPPQRAYIFSTSFGSTIALDLVANFPHLIAGAVIHEPMLTTVLPTAERVATENAIASMLSALQTSGAAAAVEGFLATFIARGTTDEARVKMMHDPRGGQGTGRNFHYAFTTELPSMKEFEPDVQALKALQAQGRLVLVAGEEAKGLQPWRATECLAEQVGGRVVGVKGAHTSCFDPGEAGKVARDVVRLLAGGKGKL